MCVLLLYFVVLYCIGSFYVVLCCVVFCCAVLCRVVLYCAGWRLRPMRRRRLRLRRRSKLALKLGDPILHAVPLSRLGRAHPGAVRRCARLPPLRLRTRRSILMRPRPTAPAVSHRGRRPAPGALGELVAEMCPLSMCSLAASTEPAIPESASMP